MQAAVVLSLVALASAGVVQLSHGYGGGEAYGHEAVAYAPVAQLAHYEAQAEHVDYHVSYLDIHHQLVIVKFSLGISFSFLVTMVASVLS